MIDEVRMDLVAPGFWGDTYRRFNLTEQGLGRAGEAVMEALAPSFFRRPKVGR